ncbi:MAG: hypothetical protein GX434_13670 [Peptococcaceae bacterium]|nr:hypothetical protein [Peptococcaceae bacterium]
MNGLRYVFGLCLVFFAVIIGLQSGNGNTGNGKDLLRTTDVVEAFYQHGTEITLSHDLSPAEFLIENKLPAIYEFPGSGEKLFIYEFSDMNRRNEALAGIYQQGSLDSTEGFRRLQYEQENLINPIRAKNILLIYVIQYDSKVVSEIKDVASLDKFTSLFAPNLELIKNIVLEDLNDGVKILYQGKGQAWEGKVLLEYYQYSWIDESGKIRSESWSNENFWVKYLGKDSKLIKQIVCSYHGPAGNGQGVFEYADRSLDKDGYVNLGSSGGTGMVNTNGEYFMTIGWGEKSETFTLEKP